MTYRTHDHEQAIAYANREAIRTGISQKVTIHRSDIPVKGAEFHVEPVDYVSARLEVIDEASPGNFVHRRARSAATA